MSTEITTYLKYANLQMAAESLFGILPTDPAGKVSATMDVASLELGNRRASVFTEVQASKFLNDDKWTVVEHKSNTATGFSGTLFKNTLTNEFVLSFRSTEFIDDAARDNQATNALELKEKGWAFGQIDDMETWFASLKADPEKLGGNAFSVTGYSLGGHLATAFNLLHKNDLTSTGTPLISATYTFNGAGVGQYSTGTLNQVMDVFHQARTEGSAGLFTTTVAQLLYADLKTSINGQASSADMASAISSVIQAKDNPTAGVQTLIELNLLLAALTRTKLVRDEIGRVSGITNSAPSGGPAPISASAVDAVKLDYQLAVLTAANSTNGYRTGNPELIYDALHEARATVNGFSNLYDIYGDTSPSAVASSQLHYGSATPIAIEDQPLFRGNVISDSVKQSLLYAGVKLLVDDFSKNDFGDTHSLVLLIDSLTVQSIFAQLDSTFTAARFSPIMAAASNVKSHNEPNIQFITDGQGVAEGDALENIVNALVRTFKLDIGLLKGNTRGNTWFETKEVDGYSGRDKFHEAIANLVKSNEFKLIAGDVVVSATGNSMAAEADTYVDFEDIVALETLSPFKLEAANEAGKAALETLWASGDWSNAYQDWKDDVAALQAGGGVVHYTDEWISDRAKLLQTINFRNAQNQELNHVRDPSVPSDRVLFFDYDESVGEHKTISTQSSDAQGLKDRHIIFDNDQGNIIQGYDNVLGDRIYGGGGDDTIDGKAGGDYLQGDTGNDTLKGGDGNDTLMGGKGDDTLEGGKGNDILKGGDDNDTYILRAGEDGVDTIIDSDGKGAIKVIGADGAESDLSVGTIIKLTTASNTWQSEDKRFTYTTRQESDGSTTLLISGAGVTARVENFSSGNLGITLPAAPAAEPPPAPVATTYDLTTAAGRTAWGYGVANTELGYHLRNAVQPRPGDPVPRAYWEQGLKGNDIIEGGAALAIGQTVLRGNGGDDRMYAQVEQDLQVAIDQGEILPGSTSSNYLLDGGAGKDLLIGTAGADALFGGAGDDTIVGGAGGDLILSDGDAGAIAAATGTGWVTGSNNPLTGESRNLAIVHQGARLYLSPSDSSGQRTAVYEYLALQLDMTYDIDYQNLRTLTGQDVRNLGYFYQNTALDSNTPYGSQTLHDSGDSAYSGAQESFNTARHNGKDTIYAGAGDDVINAGGGNDTILAGSDNDIVVGGAGDDFIWGGEGNDRLDGDAEGATAATNSSFDFYTALLKFNVGLDVSLHGSDYIDGEGGNDVIFGNGQSDFLFGGADDDEIYGDGWGITGAAAGDDYLEGGAGTDNLFGGAGADYLLGGTGDDWLLGDMETDALEDQGADFLDGGDGNDELAGAGGNDTLDGGKDNDRLFGDAGDDYLVGGDGRDELQGGADNDILEGGAGIDILFGDAGDDDLWGGDGADHLNGGDDRDFLAGGADADVLWGDAGDDVLDGEQGNDTLRGGTGNDTLDGGSGSDWLFGGENDDLYVVRTTDSSSGQVDVVSDTQGVNTLRIDGASLADIQVNTQGGSTDYLFLTYSATGTQVAIQAGLAGGAIKWLEVGGQTVDFLAFVGAHLESWVYGQTEQAEQKLLGGASSDYLVAEHNDTLISAGWGDDDVAVNSTGNTVLIRRGDGIDRIDGVTPPAGRGNAIEFGSGVAFNDIRIDRGAQGEVLLVTADGQTGASIRKGITTVRFQDGNQSFELSDLIQQDLEARATDNNDLIQGSAFGDVIHGGLGNDVLLGNEGDDTLTADGGDDILIGGEGDDTYVVAPNAGSVTLLVGLNPGQSASQAGADQVVFSGTKSAYTWTTSRVGNSLIIAAQLTASGTTSSVRLEGYFDSGVGAAVWSAASVGFGDGSVLSVHELLFSFTPATEGDDIIYGRPGAEVIDALGGNDNVFSLDGNDIVDGGSGDDILDGSYGDDLLRGGIGHDVLTGGAGADVLQGGDGNDLLAGGEGADILWGDANDDFLIGETGNDTLYGGAGVDSLQGGEGADRLEGGEDDDALLGNEGDDVLLGGSGQDTLNGGAGSDILNGGEGGDLYVFDGDPFNASRLGEADRIADEQGADVIQLRGATASEVQVFSLGNQEYSILWGTGGVKLNGGSDALTRFQLDMDGVRTSLADYLVAPPVEEPPSTPAQANANFVARHAYQARIQIAYAGSIGALAWRYDSSDTKGALFREIATDEPTTDVSRSSYFQESTPYYYMVSGYRDPDGNVYTKNYYRETTYTESTTIVGIQTYRGADGWFQGEFVFNTNVIERSVTYFIPNLTAFSEQMVGYTPSYTLQAAPTSVNAQLGSSDNAFTFSAGLVSGGDGNDQITANLASFSAQYYANQRPDGYGVHPWHAVTAGLSESLSVRNQTLLTGQTAASWIDGGAGNDTIIGSEVSDVIYGGTGFNSIDGGRGPDRYLVVDHGADVPGFDYIADNSVYNPLVNPLVEVYGGLPVEILPPGADIDTVEFGPGIFLDDLQFSVKTAASDPEYFQPSVGRWWNPVSYLVVEKDGRRLAAIELASDGTVADTPADWPGAGIEILEFQDGQSITLSAALEIAQSQTPPPLNQIIGTANDDILTGTVNPDLMDGGAGVDYMRGDDGDDIYYVDNAADVVFEKSGEGIDTVIATVGDSLSAHVENLTLAGSEAINGTGNSLNNVLIGNAAKNILNGGAGADRMVGGAGDDSYYVDNVNDEVVEELEEGTDRVISSISYVLGDNVEDLQLSGTASNNATGNGLDNKLTGNSGANVLTGLGGDDRLTGGLGADQMLGGHGNDLYGVDDAGDMVVEMEGEGTDTVESSVTHVLATNVENLLLTGVAAINGDGNRLDNVLQGNAAANTLQGGAGSDTLNGKQGLDTLVGGTGNDTYLFEDEVDLIVEEEGGGRDVLVSRLSATLAANVEDGVLLGSGVSLTGNALSNVLTGNSAANTLDGGSGIDVMVGGRGNDTYIVDSEADTVVENAAEGADTVQSSVNYSLGNNVEHLTLTGTAEAGMGNDLANRITGNAASNKLWGGAGNDSLDGGLGADMQFGGLGNDKYWVDSSDDLVVESTLEGIDTVYASVSYALADNVEYLILTGNADVNAVGNALNNRLEGNGGNNVLFGGLGSDTYVWGRGSGQDIIVNFDAGKPSGDTVQLGAGIAEADLGLIRQGNDLILSINGSADQLTVANYFENAGTGNNALEKIRFADGSSWNHAAVLSRTTVQDGSSGASMLPPSVLTGDPTTLFDAPDASQTQTSGTTETPLTVAESIAAARERFEQGLQNLKYNVDEQGTLSRSEFAERRALPLLWNLQDALLDLQLAKNPDGRFTADISIDSRSARDVGLGVGFLSGTAGISGPLGQVARPQEIQQFDLAQMQ